MFWWVNFQSFVTILLLLLLFLLMLHIISTFSALGRLILATRAMGAIPILPKEEEEGLTPDQLTQSLLRVSSLTQQSPTPINQQYSYNSQQIINEE